jgi:ABC-type uncharacterized transport system involved in gliding motility auxiliary subunit
VKRIIGLLGWVGVALVVASVVIKFTKPEWPYQMVALAGLILTVLYVAAHWREFRPQGRSAQYGSIAAGGVLAFLAILIAINWIASRQNHRWDLTESKSFTLSDQTKQIVSNLKGPLHIRVFYAKQQDSEQAHRDRLDSYEYLSKQVSVEYIDANAKPTEAEKYEVTAVPTLVLEYGGRTQRATSDDETAMANVLKKLIEGKAKKAYFTQGHGEHDPDDAQTPQGYKAISAGLTDENFEVAKLQIAQKGSIPADATVLIVAGATSDFLPQEADLVGAFLKNGGKLFLMIDPPPAKSATAQPTSLISLAKAWGIQVGNDIVVDPRGQLAGFDASVPVGMPLQHPINAKAPKLTAYRLARSIVPVEGGVDGHVAQTFMQSGESSWAESDVKGLYDTGRPEKNLDKGDKGGPVSLAAAVSAPAPGNATATDPDAPKPESRLVVVGDSDFASNQMAQIGGNADMFLNAMNWLAQQENLIAIRSKDPEDRRLQLTQNDVDLIFWLTVLIIPLALFANGFRVYWKRR